MGIGLSGGRHTRVVEPLGSAPLPPPTLLLLCGHLLHIHRENGHGLILLAVRVPGRGRGVGAGQGRAVGVWVELNRMAAHGFLVISHSPSATPHQPHSHPLKPPLLPVLPLPYIPVMAILLQTLSQPLLGLLSRVELLRAVVEHWGIRWGGVSRQGGRGRTDLRTQKV